MANKVDGTCTLDSAPAQGVEIDVVSKDGAQSIGRTTTDANGEYSVNVGSFSDEVLVSAYYGDDPSKGIPNFIAGRIQTNSTSAQTKDINGLEQMGFVAGDYLLALVFSRDTVQINSAGWVKQFESVNRGTLGGRFTVFSKIADGTETVFDYGYASGSNRLDATIWAFSYTGEVEPFIENIQEASSAANSYETAINYGNMQSVGLPIFAYFTELRRTTGETTLIRSADLNGQANDLTTGWSTDALTGTDSDGSRLASVAPIDPQFYEKTDDWQGVTFNNDAGTNENPNTACALAFTITCGRQIANDLPPQVKPDTPTEIVINPTDYALFYDGSVLDDGQSSPQPYSKNKGNLGGDFTIQTGLPPFTASFNDGFYENTSKGSGFSQIGDAVNAELRTYKSDLTIMIRSRVDAVNLGVDGFILSLSEQGEAENANQIFSYGINTQLDGNRLFYVHEYNAGDNVVVQSEALSEIVFDEYNTIEMTRSDNGDGTCNIRIYLEGVMKGELLNQPLPTGGDISQLGIQCFYAAGTIGNNSMFVGRTSNFLVNPTVLSDSEREAIRASWEA